jgi:anti-sigma B factor antagonist
MHVKKLSSRQEGEVSIVDVEGAITIGEGANAVRDALNGLVATNHRKILRNLAEVSFVDSSGIRELMSAFNTITKDGGQLKLLKPAQRVKDLLRITRLHTVFEVYDDEAAAVASFG